MPDASPAHAGPKLQARSRVTNGKDLLPGVDGRSTWVRRLRDLMALHLSDLGGVENVSEAEKSIVLFPTPQNPGPPHSPYAPNRAKAVLRRLSQPPGRVVSPNKNRPFCIDPRINPRNTRVKNGDLE